MKEAVVYIRAYALILCISFGAFALSIQVSPLFKPEIVAIPFLYDGKVCIQDFLQGSYRLRLVDVSSSTAQELRDNKQEYLHPLAYGGTYAVWIGYIVASPISPSNYYVQTINTTSKVELKVVENISYIEQLAAAANRVVWTDYRYFNIGDTIVELFMYDFTSGIETRITNHKGYKSAPYIMGNQIVWQDYRNAGSDPKNADIYLYDLSTGQEKAVCTNSAYQDQPSVYNNVVVWQDYRNAGSNPKNADIYMFDLSTGTERAICTAPGWQAHPKIYGNIIVWQDYRNVAPADTMNADIYLYDLATNTESAVTTKAGYVGEPFLYGSTVVWFDYTDNTIYKAKLSSSPVINQTSHLVGPKQNAHRKLLSTTLERTNCVSCYNVQGKMITDERRHISSELLIIDKPDR